MTEPLTRIPTTADNPLTQVTKATYSNLVQAMDIIFPGQDGHADMVNDMLDYGIIDRDEYEQGKTHAENLVVMGSRPDLSHVAMVAMLAKNGLSHALGFVSSVKWHGL